MPKSINRLKTNFSVRRGNKNKLVTNYFLSTKILFLKRVLQLLYMPLQLVMAIMLLFMSSNLEWVVPIIESWELMIPTIINLNEGGELSLTSLS